VETVDYVDWPKATWDIGPIKARNLVRSVDAELVAVICREFQGFGADLAHPYGDAVLLGYSQLSLYLSQIHPLIGILQL